MEAVSGAAHIIVLIDLAVSLVAIPLLVVAWVVDDYTNLNRISVTEVVVYCLLFFFGLQFVVLVTGLFGYALYAVVAALCEAL